MNVKSLRFRLTFWYAISLVIAIAVIFTSFYFITRQALYMQIDSALTSHSDKIIEVVTSQASNMHDDIAKEAFIREFSQIPGMLVVIMSASGTIVSSSQTISPKDQSMREFYQTAFKSKNHFFADRTVGSEGLRFLVSPIRQNGQLLGVVIMGHPIAVIQDTFTNLVTILSLVFVVFLFPTVFGGYLNARGAVAPISAISARLKRINSGNLNERVDNPKTGDEIEELSVTFNHLLDRLRDAFQRERQFIGDVAHELKTPLAIQRANIEIALSKDRSKENYRQALKESLSDNNRLSTVLKNILDLAWSETEAARNQFKNFNLSEVVLEIKDLGIKMAAKKRISVDGKIEPNIIIYGKKDKLERALINLVENAVKYTPQKGLITISLQKKNEYVNFKVKDTGIGIAKNDLPHIFERFYRGSKTDKTLGSGLGLSIAKAVITAHHGEIKAESAPGKGSEFTVCLPLWFL